MTPEAKQKARVKKILEELGAYFVFPIGGPYARNGVPDVLVSLNGYFLGLEIKAGKNKATALQLRELEKINASGGLGMVIDDSNIDKIEALLENWVRNRWLPGVGD